jgi:hypothetical protein
MNPLNITIMRTRFLLLLTIIGCALQFDTMAQKPNLATAGAFTFFTSAGAFTNIGPTIIDGDAGVQTGLFSGFPPGVVNGTIHIADAVSVVAATDLSLVYADVAGRTCMSTLGVSLGNNQMLSPNVYCIGAASTLNANLILNGMGDPNALFIIQIDGALASTPISNVLLINGAVADNVFWQINGAVELGANSNFVGTILANGAITLLSEASLIGRGLSVAGAINLHNNTAIQGAIALPVQACDLSAINVGNENHLKWYAEANRSVGDVFEIQGSQNGISFYTMATEEAKPFSSFYHFRDVSPYSGISYYRIKEMSADGAYAYSNIVSARWQSESELVVIYPNPAADKVTIRIPNIHDAIPFTIHDVSGRLVRKSQFSNVINHIDLSHLGSGCYRLTLLTDVPTSYTIVKQ